MYDNRATEDSVVTVCVGAVLSKSEGCTKFVVHARVAILVHCVVSDVSV